MPFKDIEKRKVWARKYIKGRLTIPKVRETYEIYHKKYRKDNKEKISNWHKENNMKEDFKEKRRNYHLQHSYGISLEVYEALCQSQNGLCAICGQKSDKKLHVDHNHNTGNVRALLCKNCNTSLGLLKEDSKIVENLLQYIKKYT